MNENCKVAQAQQKKWYDQNCRHREFEEGDHVLVLLPTVEKKLMARWEGPYLVKRSYPGHLPDRHERQEETLPYFPRKHDEGVELPNNVQCVMGRLL